MNPPLMTVMLSRLSNLEEYKTGAILRESECVLFQRGGTTLTAIQIRRCSSVIPLSAVGKHAKLVIHKTEGVGPWSTMAHGRTDLKFSFKPFTFTRSHIPQVPKPKSQSSIGKHSNKTRLIYH